jgi:hypothetical protein
MLQLITHHSYKLPGAAIDLSRFENHGAAKHTGFELDGAKRLSGAMVFSRSDSEIRILKSPTYTSLGALRIEMLVKFDTLPTTRMNLIEGHLAFAFFVLPGGTLSGTFLGPATVGAPPTWHGVESGPPFSPDGALHTVTAGKWITLTYSHDGYRGLEVAIDGTTVGRRNDLVSSVGSVGSFGTTVGNWPDAPKFTLKGQVDDLKVWRRDPDAMSDEFFSRPIGKKEGDCWAHLFAELASRLRDRDETLIALILRMEQFLIRSVHDSAHDAGFLARNRSFSERFVKLWTSGNAASREMETLLRLWLPQILQAMSITPLDTSLKSITDGVAQIESVRRIRPFDCDPNFAIFLKIVRNALGI